MLFWLIASTIAAMATLATSLPLLRRSASIAPPRAAHDEEVYRAQLAELDLDERRGTIHPADASTARAEIARRLLRANDEAKAEVAGGGNARFAQWAGLAVALLLPVGSFLFYDRWGSPEIPDQPLALRQDRERPMGVADMIAGIERRLQEAPDDGEGWSVVAPVYLQMGDAAKAVNAFSNALRLTPPTAQKRAGLGEAMVQAAGGRVTTEAEDQFRKALVLDPTSVSARFYLALGLSQQGKAEQASDAWSELLRTGPADGPWRPIAEAALADAQGASLPSGPTTSDIDAAAELSEDDRRNMVEGMVSGLAERLKANPHDADGWKRLMRSYVVLGDPAKASDALAGAEAAFPAGSSERTDIRQFARTLGIASDAGEP